MDTSGHTHTQTHDPPPPDGPSTRIKWHAGYVESMLHSSIASTSRQPPSACTEITAENTVKQSRAHLFARFYNQMPTYVKQQEKRSHAATTHPSPPCAKSEFRKAHIHRQGKHSRSSALSDRRDIVLNSGHAAPAQSRAVACLYKEINMTGKHRPG